MPNGRATMSAFWLTLFVLICTSFTIIHAELSPQAYQELKDEAEEVLSVNATDVTNVTGATDGDNCTLFFTVDAVVLDVNRSLLGYSVGDTVEIEAYTRDRSAEECELFLGPSPPELLENGWCGLVYLNSPDDGSEVLEPAAYGQSFEEYTTDQCEAAAAIGASKPKDPTSGNASLQSLSRVTFSVISLCMSLVSYFEY